METAHIYFALMVLTMLPIAVVHLLCRRITYWHPDIMPDKEQRRTYRQTKASMAAACIAALWFMWSILGVMVTFCATMPVWGFVTHIPWIAAMALALYHETRHFQRLMQQVRDLP